MKRNKNSRYVNYLATTTIMTRLCSMWCIEKLFHFDFISLSIQQSEIIMNARTCLSLLVEKTGNTCPDTSLFYFFIINNNILAHIAHSLLFSVQPLYLLFLFFSCFITLLLPSFIQQQLQRHNNNNNMQDVLQQEQCRQFYPLIIKYKCECKIYKIICSIHKSSNISIFLHIFF